MLRNRHGREAFADKRFVLEREKERERDREQAARCKVVYTQTVLRREAHPISDPQIRMSDTRLMRKHGSPALDD